MVRSLAKLTIELLKNAVRPVTVNYPAPTLGLEKQALITEEARGKHRFDDEKCVGCGGCTVICSSGAITELDLRFNRTLQVELSRCIFCGRCRDLCPEKGLELTPEFELSRTVTRKGDSVKVEHVVSLERCENCGRPTFPTKQIDAIRKRISEKIDQANRETALKDMEVYARYCSDCRRILSYELKTHPRKSY